MKPGLVSCIALLAALPAVAQPRTVEQCVAASGLGQEHRQRGALRAARRALETCSDPSCPDLVRSDCTQWLAQVLEAQPSLIVVVRVGGADRRQAQVSLDGQPWLADLSGQPQELDPGEHELAVAVDGLTATQRLIVNTGEKDRRVVFQLVDPAAPVAAVPPALVPAPASGRPFPALATASTVLAVAGVGLFTGLGLGGRARLGALEANACAASRTCDPRQVDEVRRLFAAADVSLGVGIVAAAGAAVLWWRWSATLPEVQPSVAFAPGGAAVGVRGSF